VNEKVYPNIESTRNTQEQMDFYSQMSQLMTQSGLSHQEIVQEFPVFATRQQITYFIERYELYKKIVDVPGSIIELGVAGGFGLMSFAHFCSIFEPTHYVRKIYGFDTFEGFPDVDEKDSTSSADHMKKGGLKFDSYDYLKKVIPLYDKNRFLSHLPKIDLIKGDASLSIVEFLEKNPSLVIAMLYLDVDLYQPTKVALEKLMSRIPKGGVIVFDELNHSDYPGETIAVSEVIGINNLRLRRLEFSSMAAYAIIE
jgi:hypothetical protein